jgi:hypothetical protein
MKGREKKSIKRSRDIKTKNEGKELTEKEVLWNEKVK